MILKKLTKKLYTITWKKIGVAICKKISFIIGHPECFGKQSFNILLNFAKNSYLYIFTAKKSDDHA